MGRARAALAALVVAIFCYVTTENLPIGLLPLIAADLHTTPSRVGLLVTGYGLLVAVTSVPLTVLTRRIPRRYLLSGLLVLFVLANGTAAVAPDYGVMLATRLVIALTHAVFWSVVAPTAAGLFPPRMRSRVVTLLFTGASVAVVVGVPAGTWLGHQAGWRSAFLALSVVSLVTLTAVSTLLPTTPPGENHSGSGSSPDGRRYAVLIVVCGLAVTGGFTMYTYVAPFLIDVAGFPPGAVGPLLLAGGAAGITGTAVAGALVDRWLRGTMIAAVALFGLAMAGAYLFGANRFAAVAMVALWGFALSAMTVALQNRLFVVAPGSADVAAAGTSSAFNVGIACGALLGGLLLPVYGVRSTALVGALLATAALAVLVSEPALAARRRSSCPDHDPCAPRSRPATRTTGSGSTPE